MGFNELSLKRSIEIKFVIVVVVYKLNTGLPDASRTEGHVCYILNRSVPILVTDFSYRAKFYAWLLPGQRVEGRRPEMR